MSGGNPGTSILISQDDDASLAEAFPEESSISVVTLAELHYGVLVAKIDEVRQHRLRHLGVSEATFQRSPIDPAVARAFAAVANAVKSTGRQPRGTGDGSMDCGHGLEPRCPRVYPKWRGL